MDAQFRTRNIVQDSTKYDYIVGSLSPETAGEIRELLMDPTEGDKYQDIKRALLKQIQMSDQKRLQELLSKEDLGDRKPTQILRSMKQLVGDTVFDPKMMRALFIQKLPAAAQSIMVSAADEVELMVLAEMADKIVDVTTPQINKVAFSDRATNQPSEISMLREVRQLRQMMTSMSMRGQAPQHRSPSRGRSPYRRQRDVNKHPLCWYHHRFGDKSTKCESPCNYDPKNLKRSPSK